MNNEGPGLFSENELRDIRRQIDSTVERVLDGSTPPASRPRRAWSVTADVLSVVLALCCAWTFGAIYGAVARTEATLADVERLRDSWSNKDAKAQQLLQQLEAIQREQEPPARPNRMTPNAGQVSSL